MPSRSALRPATRQGEPEEEESVLLVQLVDVGRDRSCEVPGERPSAGSTDEPWRHREAELVEEACVDDVCVEARTSFEQHRSHPIFEEVVKRARRFDPVLPGNRSS